MASPARQLSSLVSLPKILSDSLVAALTPAADGSLAAKLAHRPVYPIRLAISAEGLNLVFMRPWFLLMYHNTYRCVINSLLAGIWSSRDTMSSAFAA